MHSQPLFMADVTDARMTAFRPGASPPPVLMAMRRIIPWDTSPPSSGCKVQQYDRTDTGTGNGPVATCLCGRSFPVTTLSVSDGTWLRPGPSSHQKEQRGTRNDP